MTGDQPCHWAVRRPGHVTGPTNHQLKYFNFVFSKGLTAVKCFFFVCVGLDPSAFFDILSYKLREDYLSTLLRVSVSVHVYVCAVAANHWRLQAQILLVTFNLEPSAGALLNFLLYDLLRSPVVWSASFRRKKRTQFHLYVTVTLCNIHHRPFFRPYSVHRSWFLILCFVFDCCCLQQKDTYPFSKLGFPPGSQSPWNCWEHSAKRKMQRTELKSDTGYTIMHTSSLHATATSNRRLNPQWDWMVLGIWHNTK